MTTSTYYELNIVEGTDIVNPLIVDNPNYEKIDETMHNNAVAGVTLATEITNATVHAITRENSDCAVIRFIATSQWKAGDSVTVDGVSVTALLPSGETLPDGAYVINANVLCILTGTNLTVYVGGKNVENANQIPYNETNVGAELDKLNGSVEQINGSVAQINSDLTLDFSGTSIPSDTNFNEVINMLMDKVQPSIVYITTGLSIYENRVSITKGGYYVKNGICYIDMYIKALKSIESGGGVISNFPNVIGNSLNDGSLRLEQYSGSGWMLAAKLIDSNQVLHFVGNYQTDHSDT